MLSVYGIFNDATNELVYVGISSNPVKRFQTHLYTTVISIRDNCRMEILESGNHVTKKTEAFWIEYCFFIGCKLYNSIGRLKRTKLPSKKPIGVRLPNNLREYYALTAKAMGITLGERIRRVLEQEIHTKKTANAGN